MSDKAWKRAERRVARFFGTERTPLSGINSRHETSSDALHSSLYIEAKYASGPTGTNGWVWRWLSKWRYGNGLTVFCGPRGYFYVHYGPDFEWNSAFYTERDLPAPAKKLWRETHKKAAKEHKAPLLALFCKRRRGFWLVGEAGAMLKAIEVRKAVVELKPISVEGFLKGMVQDADGPEDGGGA